MANRACILVLTALAAWAPSPGSETATRAPLPPLSISFRDQTTVEGETIRLGDVARIIAGEERIVALLETLEVAKSAGYGLTRMLDTEYLYARFLKRYENDYAVTFDRKTIRIATRAAVLPMDSLARVVDAFISAQPKSPGAVLRWEIARAPSEIMVPVGPHSLELAFSGARRKGKVDLNLSVRNGTRTLRNIPITLNLRVDEPVLVARRKIEKDVPLDAGNATVEMRETTQLSEAAMVEPGRMLGLLARTTIAPGRIITPRLVAMAPTVKRGQEAKIIYRTAGVSVTADAVCRQDGMTGQIITAKSLVSQRLVRVRVTADGLLEPIPGG